MGSLGCELSSLRWYNPDTTSLLLKLYPLCSNLDCPAGKSFFLLFQFVVADRWYPSSRTCSACGPVKSEWSLSDRQWICAACGAVDDRDVNAAVKKVVSRFGYVEEPYRDGEANHDLSHAYQVQ